MFHIQAPSMQFQPEQFVKVNLIRVALTELSSFLPRAGKVLSGIALLCEEFV